MNQMYKKITLTAWIFTVIIMLLLTNHWSNNLDKLNARLDVNKQETDKLQKEIKGLKVDSESKNKRINELESKPQ